MRLRETERKRTGFSPALGLLLLSALWAIAWMRSDLFPQLGADVLSTAQSQAALFSIFAVVAASIAFVRGIEFPRGHSAWAPAGIGVGLFVIPTGLVACAHGWVSNLDQIAVFSLTPILAVVLEPYLQDNDLRQGEGALMSALIAITGILCLFPLDLPNSLRAGLAWCALLASVFSIAATNCLAVNLARSLPERSTVPIAAQAAAASALCFAAAALFAPRVPWRLSVLLPQLLWVLLIDLPALFLLFWLMRRLAASRMTARFLLAPLFATLAGMALDPTRPPIRGLLGIALLAGGAGWLLFAPAKTSDGQKPDSLTVSSADLD